MSAVSGCHRCLTRLIGRSVEGRPLHAHVRQVGDSPPTVIFGGFHGDEPKSVRLASRLVEWLAANEHLRKPGSFVVVPIVNPDGYARRRRRNARGVDINRNFPTVNWEPGRRRSRLFGGDKPRSEPETRAVIRLIEHDRPTRIVTIHSIDRHRHCNNYDGPAKVLAEGMTRWNGYPVTASIGYPTPGSFGNWAGLERRIPTVTLELPSHHSVRRCLEENHLALLFAIFGEGAQSTRGRRTHSV